MKLPNTPPKDYKKVRNWISALCGLCTAAAIAFVVLAVVLAKDTTDAQYEAYPYYTFSAIGQFATHLPTHCIVVCSYCFGRSQHSTDVL